jgi:hypothetical protein
MPPMTPVPLFFVVVLRRFRVRPGHMDPETAAKWAPEGST